MMTKDGSPKKDIHVHGDVEKLITIGTVHGIVVIESSISRTTEFLLELQFDAVHATPLRWVHKDDPRIPPNAIIELRLGLGQGLEKSHPWLGIPTIHLKMLNMGPDIQVRDAVLELNDSPAPMPNVLPDGRPNIDAISAASLFSYFIDKSETPKTPFVLKSRHEKSVSCSTPIFRPIILRGIRHVYIEDVGGARRYVDEAQIEQANTYLREFFDPETLDACYQNFYRAMRGNS